MELFEGVFCDFSTIDPAAADVIRQAFLYHHPLESRFPIDGRVKVITSRDELALNLMKEMSLKRHEAIGAATDLTENPPQVIGIQDLEENGITKPFVSVMTDDGYMFVLRPEQIEPI